MDQILKGIVNSNHPKALKQQLIDRCLISLPAQSISPSDYLSVVRISWEYAINGESEFVQDLGIKIYTTWLCHNQTLLAEFFSVASLNNFLSDESVQNKDILLKLIGCTLKELQGTSNFSNLCQVVQCRCTSYLHNNRTLPVLKQLIKLLQLLPLCIPCGESAGTLAVIIIQSIADTEIPKSINNYTNFVADINAVSSFLSVLWSENKGVIEKVFNAIFLRLSSEDSSCSLAISSTIDILPLQLIDNIHSNIKGTSLRKLAIAIFRMLDCLSWPGVSNLHKWIISIFRGLAEASAYALLARVFEATIEQVYNKLYITVARKPALAVLNYMLLSYQHSPILFHKITGDIPKLLAQLKEQELNQKSDLEEVERLFFNAMHLHAGYPDLYDPILKELESFQAPSMAMMQEELTKYQWGNVSKYRISSFNVETGKLKVARSQTGLTGLENIGNTCYINSILQALYMTNCMRKAVLEAKPNSEENLLAKLQEVFAYLALTQRPAYSPKKFVESSLPPWFEHGEQQDCAEFLRFTLNTLTEEWKAVSEKEQRKPNCSENAVQRNESDSQRSFIEDIFGGILETSHRCLNCNNTSAHSERFTDFHIPFPDCRIVQNLGSEHSAQPLLLKDLFDKCFEPERLEGENKYHCEKCNAHCIAERYVRITHLPSHLILALLRFSYDSKSGRRTKILTEVDCPVLLRIPFNDKYVDYYLYAVIVHAGTSAEQGHYYTFARHFQELYNIESSTERENLHASGDNGNWYLLNDSNISYSSFNALRNLTQRYSKDTAYVLFYQKMPVNGTPQESFHQSPYICNELRKVIADDNMKYLMEQENEAQADDSKTNLLDFKCSFYKDFDDPPSGGCGSSSGGSDMSFPRFVC